MTDEYPVSHETRRAAAGLLIATLLLLSGFIGGAYMMSQGCL